MENIENLIGKKVKEAREKLGMSQKELAANAKCSLTTINRLENGRQFPHSETLKDIASQLKLSYAELFLEKTENQNTDLEDRIANAIKNGFEALNAPTVPKLDTERDRLIFAITSQLATMNEDKLRTIRSFVNDMLHLDTAAIKVKRTK